MAKTDTGNNFVGHDRHRLRPQRCNTLGGTTTVQTVNGVATFSGLTLTTAGKYTFAITDGVQDALITNSFTVSPGSATSSTATCWAARGIPPSAKA